MRPSTRTLSINASATPTPTNPSKALSTNEGSFNVARPDGLDNNNIGQATPVPHNGGGTESATVVVELGPEVQRLLASCPSDAAKWYTRILNHDLRIGVGVDIVKTIWGPDFLLGREAKTDSWKFNGCALAKPWEDVWPRGDAKYPLGVERKLDGERALIFAWPATGEIIVATRNAKRRNQIEQVLEFKQQVLDFVTALDQSHTSTPMFIDGEFMAAGWNQTSSLVRRTKNFDPAGFLQHIRLMLFDWAPLASYLAGEFAVPWIKRKSMLILAAGGNHVRATPIKFSPNIFVLGHTVVYNEEQLQAEYNACLDAGHEGIVAKVMDAPELFKRTTNNIKLKPSAMSTTPISNLIQVRFCKRHFSKISGLMPL